MNSSSTGKVVRIVGDSLVYVLIVDNQRTLSFIPSVIENYRGETLDELNIREGAAVDIEWDQNSGLVTRVYVGETPSNETEIPLPTRVLPETHGPFESLRSAQRELQPDQEIGGTTVPRRAIPMRTRKFGKLVDTSGLLPGDLLLSRDLQPDKVSQLICDVQGGGGYDVYDARWTHAAMYVGDGASVVEATFDSLMSGGDVRLTSLDDYCDGSYSLRFRRSRFLETENDGWRVCVRALSRLKTPYSFGDAIRMWFNVVIRDRGFFGYDRWQPLSSAVICSTLYADAYNEATRRCLGEVSGACVPAWLSLSDEFDDLLVNWLEIRAC
jgi:hypothetical protein